MKTLSSNGMGRLAVAISVVALLVSFLTPWYNHIKPFELSCQVYERVGIHWAKLTPPAGQSGWSGNLGLYLNIDFQNNSPQSGNVTDLGVVLYREANPADKYFLELMGFRVLDSAGASYIDSEEKLPLLFQPWQRSRKMAKFVFDSDIPFPIAQGTYVIEVLVWLEDGDRAAVSRQIRIEFTQDIVDTYGKRKDAQSTTIQTQTVIGYTPRESRKLTDSEYRLLK
jgi:hypothetical protein